MIELENQLAAWLKVTTPEPPHQLGVEHILEDRAQPVDPRERRQRRAWGALVASGVVVLVGAGAFAASVLVHSHAPSSGTFGGPRAPGSATSSSVVPRWALTCVPPKFGARVTTFDGLTYNAALSAARREGLRIDVLCSDGTADIGQPPITSGSPYVRVALKDGRIIFARARQHASLTRTSPTR